MPHQKLAAEIRCLIKDLRIVATQLEDGRVDETHVGQTAGRMAALVGVLRTAIVDADDRADEER